MVLGTCTTRSAPFEAVASLNAVVAVSSPPTVTSMPTPSLASDTKVSSISFGSLVGLAREMPRYDPPRKWMVLVFSGVSWSTWSVSPAMTQRKPSCSPTTSTLAVLAAAVTAAMTWLMPGAGPPAQAMASFLAEASLVVVIAGEPSTAPPREITWGPLRPARLPSRRR